MGILIKCSLLETTTFEKVKVKEQSIIKLSVKNGINNDLDWSGDNFLYGDDDDDDDEEEGVLKDNDGEESFDGEKNQMRVT